MNDIRQILEKGIFSSVLELSDINFQKKAWFAKYENYISSYAELYCTLFDDYCFSSFIRKDVYVLKYNYDFINKLRQLEFELNNFDKENKLTDLEVVNNPQWHKISGMAKKIICDWPHLAEIITSAKERISDEY